MDGNEKLRMIAELLVSSGGIPSDRLARDHGLVKVTRSSPGSSCPHCGSYVKPGSKFCDNCWEKI